MAITVTQTDGIERMQSASGSYLDSAGGTNVSVTLGFTPRFIELVNETDRIMATWRKGMDATKTIKTAANGDATLDTASIILINADGRSFTFTPATAAKQYRWRAHS